MNDFDVKDGITPHADLSGFFNDNTPAVEDTQNVLESEHEEVIVDDTTVQNDPAMGDTDTKNAAIDSGEQAPLIPVGLSPMYDIEDISGDFDMDKLLEEMSDSKKKKSSKNNGFRDERKDPATPFVKIKKLDIWRVLNTSDLLMDNKLNVRDGKLSFIDFEIIDEDNVYARFCDKLHNVVIKIIVDSKDMMGEAVQFFRPDLKEYNLACAEEDFIITKIVVNDKCKYMSYLFNHYLFVKQGLGEDSNDSKRKRKSLFFDKRKYEHRAQVNSAKFREFLEPITAATESKSKGEKDNKTNRVHFHYDYAAIVCKDKSFLIMNYPEGMMFPECTIGTALANLLFLLLPENQQKAYLDICTNDSNNRIKVIGDEFELTAPLYNRTDQSIYIEHGDILSSLENEKFTVINKKLLERVAKYSCGMHLASEQLIFEYDTEGNVVCKVVHEDYNKDYIYKIHLNPTKQDDFMPTQPIGISSVSLRKLLSAFSDNDTVSILIRDSHVILKSSNGMNIVLYAFTDNS